MAESTELIVVEKLNPIEVFTPEGIDAVLKTIQEKALAHVPNMETAAGRKDIASLAFKVARSKTLLDEMGKKLVEDAKKTVKTIDGHRKQVRDFLDGLKEKVRQPLTEWEEEEERRKAEAERKAQEIAQERVSALGKVGITLPFLTAKEMSEDDFSAMLKEATEIHEEEQKRIAEEKRVAAEKAEQERKEREAEAAKLAAERAELDRIRAEQERQRKAEEEKWRLEKEAAIAKQREEEALLHAEREKIEAERRAVEDARREQERQAELERAKKEAAERAIREAKEREEREAKEKAEAERKAAEEAARQEALKPDKEKLKAYSFSLVTLPEPELNSDEAKAILKQAREELKELHRFIINTSKEL